MQARPPGGWEALSYPDFISSKTTWAGGRRLMSERGEDREKASADRSGVRLGLGGARVLHQAQRTAGTR